MSPRSLELDPIRLTSYANKLKLRISSVAQLSVPQSLAYLADNEVLDALSSGRIWLRRGAHCTFKCQIFFDGHLLDTRDHREVLEGVGYEIRDATLWSQLFLSPATRIFSNEDAATSETSFTIRLGQGKPPPELADSPRAWLSGNIDIRPPDSVLCAQFEHLFIKLEFSKTKERPPMAKDVKRNTEKHTHTDFTDLMLLEALQMPTDDQHFEEFKAVVQFQSQQLSKSIAECFDPVQPEVSSQGQMLFDIIPPLAAMSPMNLLPRYHMDDCKGAEDSVPEIFPLVETFAAIGACDFKMQEPHFQDSEMLLTTCSLIQENLIPEGESQEEDMLLSQPLSDVSLVSQLSTCSTSALPAPSQLTLASPVRNSIHRDLDLNTPCGLSNISQLVQQGLHILIGGHGRRAHQETKDIQLKRPHPETTLSRIAPSIFSPGFRELMSHNAKFLPIISHTLSITLLRNVQSSTLRSNLLKLAQSDAVTIPVIDDGLSERGSVGHLAGVVQARLWTMMQNWVYDPSAAKKLSRGNILEGVVPDIDSVEEDLLGPLGHILPPNIESSTTAESETGIDEACEDTRDDFEDLLAIDDTEEDLLAYFDKSEIERLEIEQETDGMLLGAGWDDGGKELDDQILLLLESGGEEDSMLL